MVEIWVLLAVLCAALVAAVPGGSCALAQEVPHTAAEILKPAELAASAAGTLREKDYDRAILLMQRAISCYPCSVVRLRRRR
jgi:hypothetical protein